MFRLDPSLPVNPEKDFDPGPQKWRKQEKLDAFKKRFSEDQMPALFNESTLQSKVLCGLQQWEKRKEKPKEIEDETPKPKHDPKFDDDIQNYKIKAESLHATLPVAGFVTQLKVPIDIDDIYVPLHAMVDLRGIDDKKVFADASDAEKCLRAHNMEISLPDAFRQSEERGRAGAVILGDPGSGKTTHLKRILLTCLRNGPETIGLPADMLPLFLPLRELDSLNGGLDTFIQAQLSNNPNLKTPKEFGEKLLKRGSLLLLLDGLDEVADIKKREEVAKWITDAVEALPTCRFVVTCRFAGYSPTVHLNEAFLETHIRPMNKDQAERFIQNWYGVVEKGLARDPEQAEGIAKEKAESLIKRLREPDFRTRRVFELTRNPLLLTNICLVHRHRGGLPHKRARLYEECIDVLLEHWRGSKGLKVVSAQSGRRALQPAALWLHSEEGCTRATAEELGPHIEPVLKAVNWTDGGAKDFLKTIRDESGLLTGWDQERYGFMHLGFQEYLAAREIRSRAFDDPAVLKALASHFGESWWREVGLLMIALEDPSLFVPYMREVVKLPAFFNHSNLVDECLDDAAEKSPLPFLELLQKEPADVKGLWERQYEALRILRQLDMDAVTRLRTKLATHPYFEIRRLIKDLFAMEAQDIVKAARGGYELVRIQGGVFKMGSPESEEGRFGDEGPQHEVHVTEFYMGRYPVTNDEYGLFLKENLEIREPEYWANSSYNQSRQPVVGVNWDDAQKYAEWAGVRLPTEAEWEYACRAGTSTRFYTGDTEKDLNRAGWYTKNSGDKLHPVGEKEPNKYGLYDMHGNIWEWVGDDWHAFYTGAPSDWSSAWVDKKRGSNRVIRGGSWIDVAQCCRSAYRNYLPSGLRNRDLGFRLSRSVSLTP
ncbi:MAG: SUMF1/EgtB/PvdO family nonheme iron enzyme [bacterium]